MTTIEVDWRIDRGGVNKMLYRFLRWDNVSNTVFDYIHYYQIFIQENNKS